jgi:hypothetical protein
MKLLISLAILSSALALAGPAQVWAEEPAQKTEAGPADVPAGGGEQKDPKIVLTKEELAEKDARKACKVDLCTAFRNPAAKGSDISCGVIKSWRKEQLVKMVAKMKVTWPYGPVRCTSQVQIKRDELVKAVTQDKHTTQLDKHAVICSLDSEKADAKEIKFEFSPKVMFEKGKAISAKMNWGKIEAPALIKSAMWTATAADNTVNMLSGTLIEDINDFIGNKCDEVKDVWEARK